MSQKNKTDKDFSTYQKGNAGRDLIQVGRDYVQNIQVNAAQGRIVSALVLSLPILLAVVILWNIIWTGFRWISPGSNILNQGQAQILQLESGKLYLIASTTQNSSGNYTILSLNNIPLSDYNNGIIKIGNNGNISGTLSVLEPGMTKEYKLNTKGTDLTLQLSNHPTNKGEFVRGKIYGKVTDGSQTKDVSYDLVVPIQ